MPKILKTARRAVDTPAVGGAVPGDGPGRRAPSARAAARSICLIGALSGLVTLLSALLPGPAGLDRPAVGAVGVLTMALSGLLLQLPWRRLELRATLAFVPVALVLIGTHNALSAQDAYRYGVFFLALFVWIGLWHPRGTSLLFAPFAALAYVVPLLLGGAPAYAPWTAVYALSVYVVVGEVIARRSASLAAALARLELLARTDPLTELPNRTVLEHHLTDPARAYRSSALVYLDVDDFKTVNDTLGHAGGDAVLRRVADALRGSIRDVDVPLRIAGDEFAVLLAGPVSRAEALAVADRVHERLRAVEVDGFRVSSSIGLAWRAVEDTPEQLLSRADEAMYRAKAAGRAGVSVAAGAPVH